MGDARPRNRATWYRSLAFDGGNIMMWWDVIRKDADFYDETRGLKATDISPEAAEMLALLAQQLGPQEAAERLRNANIMPQAEPIEQAMDTLREPRFTLRGAAAAEWRRRNQPEERERKLEARRKESVDNTPRYQTSGRRLMRRPKGA